jgi:hypothetical protein
MASVQTMEDVLARSLAPQRFNMFLIVLLAPSLSRLRPLGCTPSSLIPSLNVLRRWGSASPWARGEVMPCGGFCGTVWR